MKKVAYVLMVMAISAFITNPLKAETKVTWGGTFYSYTFFWQNQDFNKNTEDGDNFTYLHAHLHALADFGGGVKAFIKAGGWGEFGMHPIWGTNMDGGTDPQVGVLEAYAEIDNLFDLPVSVKVGKFNQLYGDGAVLFDGGEDGILGFKATLGAGPISLDILYDRLAEAGGIEKVGAMDTLIDDDLDLLGAYGTFSMGEMFSLSPYVFMRMNDTPGLKDHPMWLGGRMGISPVNFATLTLEFTMMGGKMDFETGTDINYKGKHLLAKLDANVPNAPVSLGGAYVMFSGDDATTTEDNEGYFAAAENPYTFGFYKWWPGFGPAHLMTTGYGFACVAPWNPTMSNLNVINGYLGFAMNNFDMRLDFFNYSRNWVASGQDKPLGNEFALHAHYSYKGLIDLGAAVGYWMPGDRLKAELGLTDDDADNLLGGFVYIFKSF